MRKTVLVLTLATTTLFLGACATYEPYPGYDYDRPVVHAAPPPVPYEYAGYPPAVGYIWIGGYWNWIGARYVWMPGRWEAPRSGQVWVPQRWERDGDRWHSHGGRWEPDRSQPRVIPAPDVEHRDRMPSPQRLEPVRPAPVPAIGGGTRVEPQSAPRVEREARPAPEHRGDAAHADRSENRPSAPGGGSRPGRRERDD